MSIANRITSMENNIRNAYHGLESVGLDTSNIDKNIEITKIVTETVDYLMIGIERIMAGEVTTGIFNLLALGGTSNSAFNEIKMMLHEYTSYNESITIQSIPIYHLEPNTRIGVRDIESDIYGDYMISSISIPLDISSTMSISATRALERF